MKRMAVMMMSLLLVFTLGTTVFAEGPEDPLKGSGTADLTLAGGGLYIVADRNLEGFQGVGAMSVEFGENNLTGVAQIIPGKEKVGVIVTDARGLGERSLWNVTAKLGDFHLMEKNGQDELVPSTTVTLAGASLEFRAESNAVVPNATIGKPSIPQTSIELDSGATDATRILLANSDQGSAGTWGASWGSFLTVPGNAEEGTHQATLTWTLGIGL